MNNFKRYSSKNTQARSVDGFIPNTPRLDRPDPVNEKSWTANTANQEAQIDELPHANIDGFISSNQRAQALPSLQRYAPVTNGIPNATQNKRRLWGRKSKKTSTPKSRKRKFIMRGAIASFALLFIGAAAFGANIWWNSNKVLKGGSDGALALNSEVEAALLKGEGDGRVNVLLLGKGGGNHPGADLTDSILVVSIDPIAKEASLLSIPRDLWVRVPDYWSMKINSVYSSAKQKALTENNENESAANEEGVKVLSDVLEETIGIPIHYYSVVNFDAFKQTVDAVGGISINVKEPLYDYNIAWENGGSSLIADAGPQSFNGQKALLYARSRYTSSDFARGERQREIVVGLKEKILQLGTFSNPVAVTKLINAVGDNVSTNISLGEMMRMYEIAKTIPTTSIASIGFTDEPNVLVKTGQVGDQSVVIPRRGVDDFSEIQSFVRNALRDGFLKSENATVIVLNGTNSPGLATVRAEELKSFGYNVVLVDDAPTSDYQATVLLDTTNGYKKYTKRYLEQRLGVQAATSVPGITPDLFQADFIVIVGNNEAAID